jgi:RNA polymerase-binding transcription factor DksA
MATAADILGSNRVPSVPRCWAGYYDVLCEERDRLLERDCSAPESSATKLDELADAGAEETQRDIFFVTAEATRGIIQEVLDAIRRIERGTYGICEITGQPIEADRLEAIPWTRYSLVGQEELEKNGFGRRTRLPELSLVAEPDSGEEDSETEAE